MSFELENSVFHYWTKHKLIGKKKSDTQSFVRYDVYNQWDNTEFTNNRHIWVKKKKKKEVRRKK